VFANWLHDVAIVQLLEFSHCCCFAVIAKFLHALFEVVLSHHDALQDHM
jgi:hypothetical protein